MSDVAPHQADALAEAVAKAEDPHREYLKMRRYFFADELERWNYWYLDQLERHWDKELEKQIQNGSSR